MTKLDASKVLMVAQHPLLYLQPIVAGNGVRYTTVRYEALARFSVDGAICMPGQILHCIKTAGQLPQFDRAMVLAVAIELSRRQKAGYVNVPIHVNVSQQTLADTRFAEYVLQVLRFNQVAPQMLVVEIIEGRSFWNNDHILRTLTLLEQGGVGVAIDDFPNYEESAELLYRLRFGYIRSSIVKIDRGFVSRALGSNADSEAMHELGYYAWHMNKRGMTLIAEGVETEMMCRELERIGVRHMQGYLFGRPQPASDVRDTDIVPLTSPSYLMQRAA